MKVEFICERCETPVKRYKNPNCSDRFCSRKCYYAWKSSHPEENYFHKFPRIGKLNGNYGGHENYRKNVDMRVIGAMGARSQGLHRPTKPEIALYSILDNYNIEYEKQKRIERFVVDAFVFPNLAIEVDGEYWHNYPDGKDEDRIRDRKLKERGVIVHRFWAKEILNNGEEKLKWLLNLSSYGAEMP